MPEPQGTTRAADLEDVGPMNMARAEHYVWGEVCDGWRLLDGADLSVIEERMPPGSAEARHHHARANQLFYVLDGRLTIELGDTSHTLKRGDALNVRPGAPHQARNESDRPVRFLVISAPSTRDDRQEC